MTQDTVGSRIARLVAAHPMLRALSQKEVASRFGVTYEGMRQWSVPNGKSPSPKRQQVISQVLGIPPETFMYGVDLESYTTVEPEEVKVDTEPSSISRPNPVALPVSRKHERVPVPSSMPTVRWGDTILIRAHERFIVELPDDSMEPILIRGTKVIIDRGLTARNKDIVLIEDATGAWYLGMYAKAPNGRWEAKFANSDFIPLTSEKDSIRIIGVYDGSIGRRG